MNKLVPNYYFYILDILEAVTTFIETVAFISLVGAIMLFVAYSIAKLDDAKEDTISTIKQYLKKSIVSSLVFVFVYAVIPSKQTVQYMMINSYITEDNVDKTIETIKDATDYVFEKMNEK